MRALVTGGAGFIGSALCRTLVGLGVPVVVIDSLTYAGDRRTLEGADADGRLTFVRADINDRELLGEVFARERPTIVFHLAAESHVDRSIEASSPFIRTNIDGTYTLLEAVRSYLEASPRSEAIRFRFCHVSTDEVFGELGDTGAFTEQSALAPRSPYAASKAAADHLALAWAHTYRLPVLVANCSNNYGPYQFPEKLIPMMITKGLSGAPMSLYGDGLHVRDWLHVEDHVAGLIALAGKGVGGARYLFGGRAERTNLQVAQLICDLLDELRPDGIGSRRRLIEFADERPGHDRRYAVDCTHAEQSLDWHPQRSFESGLRETVRWYLEHQEWWRSILEGKYDGRRLGLLGAGRVRA